MVNKIKGEKTMIRNLKPKLCEQGKIKIGRLGDLRTTKDGKSTYRLPNKLDHFLITTTERDKSGNFIPNVPLMKEIAEIVNEPADHLTSIPVYLLFDDIDSNFYTTYNCYQGKTRICTGNGEKAVLLKTGEEVACPCEKLSREYHGPTPCKPYGRLNVILQSMDIVGGAWVYRTTGWNSVQDILGSLFLIKRVAGRLSGIPLVLKLFPKTTQISSGPVTIYTVSLVYQGSSFALAEEARQIPAIGHDSIIAPDQAITQAEESEIAEEFYPGDETEVDVDTVTENIKEPAEKKEPTAADLAQKAQETIDAKTEKQEKARAAAAEKTKKVRTKREQKKEETAQAAQKKEEEERAKDRGQAAEGKAPEAEQEEPPIVDEGEVVEGPPENFGWV